MIQNLLFIYQQEHYDHVRFLQFVYTNCDWFNLQKRQKLDKTIKVKLILLMTYTFLLAQVVLWAVSGFSYLQLGALLITVILLPLVLVGVNVVISPAVNYVKKKRVSRAKNILNKKRPVVIGITGSYGKSSLKEILATSLRGAGAQVMVTPGNINTTLGVAQYIIDNATEVSETEYLILEMGAYKKGNIRETAQFVSPEYSFLTSVGPVHIERFGSQENIIEAKAELLQETKKHCYINKDVGHTKESAALISTDKYTLVSDSDISQVDFLPDYKGITFNINNETYTTQLLAKHNLALIAMTTTFMKDVGFVTENIVTGVAKTVPFQHRLEPTYNKQTGVWVLDDSYNGNKAGFISALSVLGRAQGRKIVLTPGIVELGGLTQEIHEQVAEEYIKNVDLVLLIDSIGTRYMQSYFDANNFQQYRMFTSAPQSHSELPNILGRGDTILFSNDLTDNYK